MTLLIDITVVYLGGSRVQAQNERELLRLEAGATVGDAIARIALAHPALVPFLPLARWARNMAFAAMDDVLTQGDELALIPPVCGGSARAYLQEGPVDAAHVVQCVQKNHHGATVLFIGTVRDNNAGHAVQEMTYEAYRPMADRELEKVADTCCENGGEIRIVHRVGPMRLGDVTVAIAASHVHRHEAFVACRTAIEAIKHQVPIWKRERTPNGEIWVGWGS